DGSGTIRQTLTLRPAALSELDALVPPDPGGRPSGLEASGLTQYGLVERNFGLVRTLSSVSSKSPDRTMLTSTFEFDDVNKVTLDLIPQTPLPIQGFLPVLQRVASTRLTLELTPIAGGHRRLTIRFPKFTLDPSAEPPGQWATGSMAEMAALKNVFKDARLKVAVETETPI